MKKKSNKLNRGIRKNRGSSSKKRNKTIKRELKKSKRRSRSSKRNSRKKRSNIKRSLSRGKKMRRRSWRFLPRRIPKSAKRKRKKSLREIRMKKYKEKTRRKCKGKSWKRKRKLTKWNTLRNNKRNVNSRNKNNKRNLVKFLKGNRRSSKKLRKNKSRLQRQENNLHKSQRKRRRASMLTMTNLMATSKKSRECPKWMITFPHRCKIDLINSVPNSAGCSGSRSHPSSNTSWCTWLSAATIMLLAEQAIMDISTFNQWLTFSSFSEFMELLLFSTKL